MYIHTYGVVCVIRCGCTCRCYCVCSCVCSCMFSYVVVHLWWPCVLNGVMRCYIICHRMYWHERCVPSIHTHCIMCMIVGFGNNALHVCGFMYVYMYVSMHMCVSSCGYLILLCGVVCNMCMLCYGVWLCNVVMCDTLFCCGWWCCNLLYTVLTGCVLCVIVLYVHMYRAIRLCV